MDKRWKTDQGILAIALAFYLMGIGGATVLMYLWGKLGDLGLAVAGIVVILPMFLIAVASTKLVRETN